MAAGIFAELSNVALPEGTVADNAISYVGFSFDTGNRGGGIASEMSKLTLTRTTVRGNVAHKGGGITSLFGVVKLDEDSRVTQNTAVGTAGGMYSFRAALGRASFACEGVGPIANCQN